MVPITPLRVVPIQRYRQLKALVDKQLVSKTPTGYLVSDRFFAKWLVRGGIIAN